MLSKQHAHDMALAKLLMSFKMAPLMPADGLWNFQQTSPILIELAQPIFDRLHVQ